jgi:hypothetical protein
MGIGENYSLTVYFECWKLWNFTRDVKFYKTEKYIGISIITISSVCLQFLKHEFLWHWNKVISKKYIGVLLYNIIEYERFIYILLCIWTHKIICMCIIISILHYKLICIMILTIFSQKLHIFNTSILAFVHIEFNLIDYFAYWKNHYFFLLKKK